MALTHKDRQATSFPFNLLLRKIGFRFFDNRLSQLINVLFFLASKPLGLFQWVVPGAMFLCIRIPDWSPASGVADSILVPGRRAAGASTPAWYF